MPGGMERDQVIDLVSAQISELKNELGSVVRAEFEVFRESERKYHAEKTETVISQITGCKIDEYDDLREDLTFLRRFRRGYRKVTLVVAGSFIGLWAKSFWQEIVALLPGNT